MNCKKGDLAIVVRSMGNNVGKIVQCLELFPAGYDKTPVDRGPVWEIDRAVPRYSTITREFTRYSTSMPDEFLRPLRGDITGEEDLCSIPKETVSSK